MSLKIKIIRNLRASTISKFIGFGFTIISVPILISFLGVNKYGVWLVLFSVPAWLSMSDIGVGSVAANEMSIKASKNDWKGVKTIFQSAMMIITIFSIIVSVLLILSIQFGNWAKWLSITLINSKDLNTSLILLCLSSIISLQGGLSSGLFRAAERADLSILISGFQPILDLICILISLYSFNTIVSLSGAFLISKTIFIIGSMFVGLFVCKKVSIGVKYFDLDEGIYCLKKGLAFCLFPISNAIGLQGSTLLVNSILGPTSVVVFNTTRTLTRSSQQIMNLIGQSAWPEFSFLIGKGELRKVRKLYYLTLLSNFFFAFLIVVVLIIFGPFLYGFWTNNKIEIGRDLIFAFSLGIVGNSLWFASTTLIGASNRHEKVSVIYFFASVMSAFFCFLGLRFFGLNGGAFGATSADLLIIPFAFNEVLKITEINASIFFKGLVIITQEYFLAIKNKLF